MSAKRLQKVLATGLLLVALPAAAQSLSSGPANLPPSGFSGAQFVDAAGCVYIRAGSPGTTVWVPRLNRDRTQICGVTPTRFTSSGAAVNTGPSIGTPAAPEVFVIRKEARQEPNTTRGVPAEPIASVPRLLPGYRVAWDDGRLNPFRASRSLLSSERVLIKTRSKPPRLIDKETGEDVTAQYPEIIAPFGSRPVGRVEILTGPRGNSAPTQSVRASSRSVEAPGWRQRGTDTPRGYIRIGTFGTEAEAQEALRRLQSNGLPFAKRPETAQGPESQTIFSGPFADDAAYRAALAQVQVLGFAAAKDG